MLKTTTRIAAVIAFLWAWGWAMQEWGTPEHCRVPHEQMSDYCKHLIYN